MTATWTVPRTWVAGEKLTAALMNQYVRDEFDYIQNPNFAYERLNLGADISFTTTSFADLDATNLSKVIVSTGRDILVVWNPNCDQSSGRGYYDVTQNSVRIFGDDGGTVYSTTPATGLCMFTIVDGAGLTPGVSYTFRVQAKVTAGTLTTYAGAGTAQKDLHSGFYVREL